MSRQFLEEVEEHIEELINVYKLSPTQAWLNLQDMCVQNLAQLEEEGDQSEGATPDRTAPEVPRRL